MTMTTASMTCSSTSPTSKPTKTAASVAAACGTDNATSVSLSLGSRWTTRAVIAAANDLPRRTTAVNDAASVRVRLSVTAPTASMSMPTEIKKTGTKALNRMSRFGGRVRCLRRHFGEERGQRKTLR